LARAVSLPNRAFCLVVPAADQAKLWTVRTTRVLLRCASLITVVIRALVQPLHPTVAAPFLLVSRFPAAEAPTPKKAIVDNLA